MTSMPHLLCVDDDTDILALLTNFFRKHSHIVSTAANSTEMFAILKNQPIDLVILDVTLQDEDGFSVFRALRPESEMPVIILTPVGNLTQRAVGMEIGAATCLPKPL